MDGETEELLHDLSGQAVFDSQGEFQVDLARAREKLEQHLGLWPEDYLAFLIQAVCALGGTRLRLTTSWHSLVWEFDGPTLSRVQLEALLSEDRSLSLTPALQRLQMALFLLTRSRYQRYSLATGQDLVQWNRGKSKLSPLLHLSSWSTRLELFLPLSQLSVHWLLSRRAALSTLPEYASVRLRYKDGPVRLQLPWSSSARQREEPVTLAIAIQGRQRMALECPLAAVHELRVEAAIDYSLWFATRQQAGLRCLVYSLGYPGPEWTDGALWLYCDGLRTDLSQRQLVLGPRFQALLGDAEKRLAQVLLETLREPDLCRECLPWILNCLTRWVSHGGEIGLSLANLPLFDMAFHDPHSLVQLDALYASQQSVMYFCTETPRTSPQGTPPVVFLRPELATILRIRYSNLTPCADLFAQLETREINRQQWSQRTPESLEVSGLWASFPLDPKWRGQVGLISSDVAPRLDVFREGKWLASVALWPRFPKGLVGKVEHPDLEVNDNWTEPSGALWANFLDQLWAGMPQWMAGLLAKPEAWLVERAYDLMLAHTESQPLEAMPLIPVGPQRRATLQECRQALAEQSLPQWILEGWAPRDRGWRLLAKLIRNEDELRHWKKRLEIYQKGYDFWKSSSARAVALPKTNDLVCTVPLPLNRGEIGLRTLKTNAVQVISYRQSKRLGSNTLPGFAQKLGGLPEGLVVAVDHPGLLPNGDWTEAILEGPAWKEALDWINEQIPQLIEPLMQSEYAEKSLLAVRLLTWLPRSGWPTLNEEGSFCRRLDGQPVSLASAVAALETGPPVRVLTECAENDDPSGSFAEVWRLSAALASELSSIWGPSRLNNVEADYRAARKSLEHAQSEVEVARLPDAHWILLTEVPSDLGRGQIGLRLKPGEANRCYLRLLHQGRLLLEHSLTLCPGPEGDSNFRLEAVVDWPQAPVVATFQQLQEEPEGRSWLQQLRQHLRFLGFDPPLPSREFLWERLAYEAGGRDSGNVGFTLDLDEVKIRLLRVPLFAIEGRLWTLDEVNRYLNQENRLGYVVGEGAGPVLCVNARELHWLKLLLGHAHLDNRSYLRTALQQVAETPQLTELPLADLDYLVKRREKNRCWGLQREVNGTSRVHVLCHMRVVESLTCDWRYQVQASLQVDPWRLNQDGSVRRDQEFQRTIDDLRAEIQQAIVQATPPRYRLEMALWSWGVQENWAEELHQQALLREARGGEISLKQWVEAWEQDEGKLPFLLEEERWDGLLEQLPRRPVPLLPATLVAVASRMMRGLVNYGEGLRLAWQWVQKPLPQPPPPATYQREEKNLLIRAEYDWVEQHLVISWRGRLIHEQRRKQWPGFVLEVNWSERLLGQPWPSWDELMPALSPYWRYLHNLLQQPDLLEQNLDQWEALPINPVDGPITLSFEPTEEDVRLLLARRKAEWRRRARGHYAPIQVACEHWWGCPVLIETESSDWPLRSVDSEGSRLLYINPQHRWFRDQSVEIMAVRVCLWLQTNDPRPWRAAVEQRLKILEALGLLEK